MKKYKLSFFIITFSLVLILYSIFFIPSLIGILENKIDFIVILLLALYGYIILFLPPSFIYYFYAKLYVKHRYNIFDDPLGIFEVIIMSLPYTIKFYFTSGWYQKREEYKQKKDNSSI